MSKAMMDVVEEIKKYGSEGSEDNFYARDKNNNDDDEPESEPSGITTS
jgi:hypothetical protein